MIEYKLTGDDDSGGVLHVPSGRHIPNNPEHGLWKKYLDWKRTGNRPEPMFSDEEREDRFVSKKIDEINKSFIAAVNSPVIVHAGGKTYRMDGKEDSARRMKDAIDLAEMLGEKTIDVIDYDNAVHPGVSIADARDIFLQQAVSYRENHCKRASLRKQVAESKQNVKW